MFADIEVFRLPAKVVRHARVVERGFWPKLAKLVGRIPHAGCCVAVIGARRNQISHPLDGFGFVAPAIEKRRIIACSVASVKFAGRAPDGRSCVARFEASRSSIC